MHTVRTNRIEKRGAVDTQYEVGHYAQYQHDGDGGGSQWTSLETFAHPYAAYAFAAFLNGGGTAYTIVESEALVKRFLRERSL